MNNLCIHRFTTSSLTSSQTRKGGEVKAGPGGKSSTAYTRPGAYREKVLVDVHM